MEGYHVATLRECSEFHGDSAGQIDQSKGLDIALMGGQLKIDPDGPDMIQSIRFDAKAFTPEKAKAWISERAFNVKEFEEAKADSTDGEEVMRFDQTSAGKVERVDGGFLMANAVITRAGVFSYRLADGTTRHELRPPEEVFHRDSMKTAEMLPITNDHPKAGRVTVDNSKSLAVGFTGEKVRQDGENLRAPVKITTSDGVAAIEGGRRELSCGYRCRVERRDGVWAGQSYTHIQRRIRYNHLALVDEARAGHIAKLRLDGADAVMVSPDNREEPTKMGDKVRLDNGIEYDCAPEVAVELDKLRKDRAELQSKQDSASKATETLQGKHDALEAKVKELEKRDDSAETQKLVKARIALETAAGKRLPKEEAEKLDSMSDDEIRKAVILAKTPKAELEGKSEDYLRARFDAICEEPEQKRDDGQGRKVVGSGKPHEPVDAEKARLDAQDRAQARSEGREPEKASA
jgi:hypothetical protein